MYNFKKNPCSDHNHANGFLLFVKFLCFVQRKDFFFFLFSKYCIQSDAFFSISLDANDLQSGTANIFSGIFFCTQKEKEIINILDVSKECVVTRVHASAGP